METADASPRLAADMELLLSQIESEHRQHLKGLEVILQMGKLSSRDRNGQRPISSKSSEILPPTSVPFPLISLALTASSCATLTKSLPHLLGCGQDLELSNLYHMAEVMGCQFYDYVT